jgi:hypothetical protein
VNTTNVPYPGGHGSEPPNSPFPGTTGGPGRNGGLPTGGYGINSEIQKGSTTPSGTTDQVTGGMKLGNLRLLVSLDFAITQNILVGARAGYVLFTDPSTGAPASAFAPLHFEARFTYLIGKNALTTKGIAPLLFGGFGLGEFDAFVPVAVALKDPVLGPGTFPVNAWITAGPFFLAGGAGARYLLSPTVAATGALKVEGAFGGSAGLLPGIAPELGIQFGF